MCICSGVCGSRHLACCFLEFGVWVAGLERPMGGDRGGEAGWGHCRCVGCEDVEVGLVRGIWACGLWMLCLRH